MTGEVAYSDRSEGPRKKSRSSKEWRLARANGGLPLSEDCSRRVSLGVDEEAGMGRAQTSAGEGAAAQVEVAVGGVSQLEDSALRAEELRGMSGDGSGSMARRGRRRSKDEVEARKADAPGRVKPEPTRKWVVE